MPKVIVLDSWALMAYFRDQPGSREVERLLIKTDQGHHELLLSVINWGEVYYSTMRGDSETLADQIAAEIAHMPIEIVPVSADLELARQAAIFKATKKMSYADCFAAALAKLRNAELVTGEEEFRQVERDVRVRWLR
jgi:ribonuclease VapC